MHKALKALFLTLLPVWVIYSCSVGLQDENTTVVMAYSLSLSHVELTACIRCFPNFGPGNQTMCFWKLRVHINLHHMTWSHQNGSINIVLLFIVVLPFQQQPVPVDLATIKSISNSICCYYGIYIVAPGINHLTPRVEPNEKDGHTSQATCNLIGPCSYKV